MAGEGVTPEQIEAAADAAVARFRARGGMIPDPPARSEIPPRVPVVLPPAVGRSCPPATCYCGDCPQYKPLPPYDASYVAGSLDWQRKTGRPAERPRPGGRRRG